MKKLVLIVAGILLISGSALATTGKATIINLETGVKRAINIGSQMPKGFSLFTKDTIVGGSTAPNPGYITKIFGVEGAYLTIGAAGTSSIVYTSFDYNMMSMDIEFKPSTSTASVFTITPYTTNDTACLAASDWFPVGLVTQSGLVSTTTAPMVYTFATATTTDAYFHLNLKDINARCMKINLSVSSIAASSTALIRGLLTNY